MPNALLPVIVAVVHEFASILLIGSMFMVLAVLMPAIESVRSPRQRLRLRRGVYGRMFLYAWIGLVLLWITGIAELVLARQTGLPAHLELMAWLSLVFMLIFLFAQFGLHLKALVLVEDGNTERARYLVHRLRPTLMLAFIVAVAVAILDVAGPGLLPADLFDRLPAAVTNP